VSLDFTLNAVGSVAVVTLAGRIDRDAGTVLDDAYAAAVAVTPGLVELDFSAVDYINSTGIALIVGLLARARAQDLQIRAAGLTPHYIHIFDITRLSDFIEIIQPAKA
jgi:anti-sigma B factor antagonist